jgi:sulfite exporter TauE/SafE
MLHAFETFFRWVATMEWVPPGIMKLWRALLTLSLGEDIAILFLLFAVLLAGAAAANRFFMLEFHKPLPREALPPEPPKKGFGLKHLVLLLIAILPGGLVGSVVVYTVMGKALWRASALKILGLSMIPALALAAMRVKGFPHPEWRDALYIGGVLGLTFGVLQIWIAIKLVREYFGEPDVCVPWWPPAALVLQFGLLTATLYAIVKLVA